MSGATRTGGRVFDPHTPLARIEVPILKSELGPDYERAVRKTEVTPRQLTRRRLAMPTSCS